MIRLCVFLFVMCLSCRLLVALDDSETQEHWDAFKERYNKTYDSSETEEKAKSNFWTNLLHVILHNLKGEHGYDKNVNEHSDMSMKEVKDALCNTKVPHDIETHHFKNFSISESSIPSALDWTKDGKVTPVKNQFLDCGSCWAFSAAEAIESAYAIKYNEWIDLSEQQLVDCDYGNRGCNSGWPHKAFQYIKDAGGIVSEKCDSYKLMETGECKVDESCKRYKITGYVNVGPRGDEEAVRKALALHGPLTVAIYTSYEFIHYSGKGIFIDHTFLGYEEINHAVLLTGYGSEDGQAYWIIKNSWGESWGDKGYMKMARNYGNHLQVANYASYPIVA